MGKAPKPPAPVGLKPNDQQLRQWETSFKRLDFEIEHVWHRSLFFWGFVAAALVAFFEVDQARTAARLIIALCGFLASVAWFCANLGSKYWQSVWEYRVKQFEMDVTGPLYDSEQIIKDDHILKGRRLSLSRLAVVVSLLAMVGWFLALLSLAFDFDAGVLIKYRCLLPVAGLVLAFAIFWTIRETREGVR